MCPSILALSPAPGSGAIRNARPQCWPQISWIYRAPHAALPPSLPCLPLAPLLHPLPPNGRQRQNVTARRGQSGHSLRRSRGGSSTQFSWFQGGFVRLLFITACGEIHFVKMVRLRGVTPLTTRCKNIIFPPFGEGVCDCFFSPSCPTPLSFPPSLPSFLSAPSLPIVVGGWGWGASAASLSASGVGLSS